LLQFVYYNNIYFDLALKGLRSFSKERLEDYDFFGQVYKRALSIEGRTKESKEGH
jgi:hypothetical protein